MTDKWQVVGFLCENTIFDQEQRASLIGILPGRLDVPVLPTALSLGAFVRISPLPPANTPIRIEAFYDDLQILDLTTRSVDKPADAANEFGLDALHINIGRMVVMLSHEGVIKVTVSIDGSEPILASALRVRHVQSTPT